MTTIKIHAAEDIKDKMLRNVMLMLVALRHHSAQLIPNNPHPGQDIEEKLIISSFAAGENDLGGLEYKLTKHLQSLVSQPR
jgi:predicted RNA binding protein YcfA (HicA-like mRNA interferase family)